MTTTITPISQAVSEWTTVFPKQVTENYTSSVIFVKQLTSVAVSTITYLKNMFSEDNFRTEIFGGLKLRILKQKCEDELAQFLTTALAQAFDAFDKRYLYQLALCFYEDECKLENLIEYHIFEYSYNSDGVTMNIHSKNKNNVKHSQQCTFENIKERTMHMIRACVVIMQSYDSDLPTTYDVSIRLYYNENAPEDYQAPGFLSSESEDHLEPTLHETLKLGWVETPYHKLIARSYMRNSYRASHEAIASQNDPLMSEVQDDFETQRVGDIRCPCNKFDSNVPLLTCRYCETKQHANCFGVRENHAQHCCLDCAQKDKTRTCTDPSLLTLTAKKQECLCIFRRALSQCSQVLSISSRDLMQEFSITEGNAFKLMKLLQTQGIVAQSEDDGVTTPKEINRDQLKSVMSNFFQNSEEETMVNRLLAETFASQESLPDPVADVLSPISKISLQNASQLGQIIDTPETNNNIEDSTLKQYRQALLSNNNVDDVDMPLSGSHNPVKVMDKIGKKTSKRKQSNEGDGQNLRCSVRTKRARKSFN